MPYELFLALRYLRVRRGRRVARWTALAAVVGIACGVAALIVALALANGFRDELRDKILRGTAHLTIMRREQRAWRFMFGLYQDCACVRWSRGFTKRPGIPFDGEMRSSRLPLFLREAMPLVADGRVEVWIEGEQLRRRLLDVMTA